ncbi:MAG: D-alanyl-D-alanine carboxypeptidase [Deltaproteobacteria bacterium]|nr:D-alanyl-D-alanine carboxypeptidase [Deltaproteobacteria bacterium]
MAYADNSFKKVSNPDKATIIQKLKSMVGNEDAVLLADASGKPIFAVHENQLLIPASTLKLLTSLAALHYLGEDYHFKTEFYLDDQQNLKIKGYGDPLLISEVLDKIAADLTTHISRFHDLVLDTTYFKKPLTVPGITTSLEPYDSPNGALCVNFNTVFFKQDQAGRFISAESQTPLLPFVLPKIKKSGLREGRILLSSENEECFMYAGHLFLHFFSAHHIPSSRNVRMGKVNPSKDKLVYTHISPYPLPQVIRRLLEFSNNYMANQLMLALSAEVSSPPGTLDKGVRTLNNFAKKNLNIENIRLAEGSGISRQNRITALGMLKILNGFVPYVHLLRKEDGVYYKTGSLNGIRTRAGYILDPDGHLLPFVILVNTPHTDDKILLDLLIKYVKD